MGKEGALGNLCSSVQQESSCWDASPAQARITQGKGLYFQPLVWWFLGLVFSWHLLLPHVISSTPLGSCSGCDEMPYVGPTLKAALPCAALS